MTMTRATAHQLAATVTDRIATERPNIQAAQFAKVARDALWNAFEDHHAGQMVCVTAKQAVEASLADNEPPPWEVDD